MALDGAFLRYLKNELESKILGARIDKIFQPNKYEFIFSFRTMSDNFKLLISSRADSARIHFTKHALENPKTPFMLCMLFRKKLSGAKLISIEQKNLERVLLLKFEATDDLGEKINLTLAVEIMDKYSNIILIDQDNKIIDAIKRVNFEMSSKRLILPGIPYSMPPSQNKYCILNCNIDKLINSICEQYNKSHTELYKILLKNIQGISTVVCKEIGYNSLKDYKFLSSENLKEQILKLKENVSKYLGEPVLILNKEKRPKDFSFLKIESYSKLNLIEKKESFSDLLDTFFYEKDKFLRIQNYSQNFIKVLKNSQTKLKRKIKIQEKELETSKDREKFKVFADLISSNFFKIKKGMSSVTLENFYDSNLKNIVVPLDESLDAHQNAQKYYKKYRKLKNAENILKIEIEKSKNEIQYIDTLLDEIARSDSIQDILEIKKELIDQGYIKEKNTNKKSSNPIKYLTFKSSSGLSILVGKNNIQNDKLTLKVAQKTDMWLHVKDAPGSHTIIKSEGKTIDEKSILEAANIAAWHSKCKNSSNVAVDYTLVKNVKKPSNAKPGMVIYSNYRTLYITPKNPIELNI